MAIQVFYCLNTLSCNRQHNKAYFVLTTRSIHWFREQGFEEMPVEYLPSQKQNLYNFQRKSKILSIEI